MAFATEELRERSREAYVSNEASTDEYRETQPAKLLWMIGRTTNFLEYGNSRTDAFYEAVRVWMNTKPWTGAYVGCDEAVPVLEVVHDVLWDNDSHPYYADEEELRESLEDGD